MPIAFEAFKPVKSLLGLLPWLGRSEAGGDFQDKIQMVIFKLKELENRIVEIRVRFEKRSEELFRKTVWALKKGDKKRAEIYAQEVAHMKNLLKLVRATERLIVHAIERLKTASDVRELTEILLTFGAAIDEVRSQMQGLYPGLALAFEEINKSIKLLLVETTPPTLTDIDVDTIANEASKVLEEALRQAEEDVEKVLPDESMRKILSDAGIKIPLLESKQQTSLKQIQNVQNVGASTGKNSSMGRAAAASVTSGKGVARRVAPPVPLAVQASGVPGASITERRPRRMSEEELERKLLDYILEHGGFLDINDFTRRYGVTREEVLAALNRLHARGLIKLA